MSQTNLEGNVKALEKQRRVLLREGRGLSAQLAQCQQERDGLGAALSDSTLQCDRQHMALERARHENAKLGDKLRNNMLEKTALIRTLAAEKEKNALAERAVRELTAAHEALQTGLAKAQRDTQEASLPDSQRARAMAAAAARAGGG